MRKSPKMFHIFLIVLSFIPLIYLYQVTCQFGFYGEWRDLPAKILTEFSLEIDGTTTDITLPHIIERGTPGTPVSLTTQLENCNSQRFYVKSVYTSIHVYANDALIYSYGDPGTYPPYLADPPMNAITIELPDESLIDLRLEYHYPATRGVLILDSPIVGSYPSIFSTLLNNAETHLFLYFVFLIVGIFLICMGLLIRILEQQGIFFVWLGLITLNCGLWGLGEYDLTSLFIHNTGLIALITFTSIFYLPIPVHCFFYSTVGYRNPRPMAICIALCLLVATTIIVLQATALLPFYNALSYFQWFAAASFLFGIGYTIYEWRAHDNQLAKQFLLPWCIVILAALAEVVRFSMGYIDTYGQFVQLALLFFILINTIIGGTLIQKAFALREQNRRIEQEYKMMEVQVSEQHRYQHMLLETRQNLRQQRHDLHHQLAVIRHLAKEGELDKLDRHLDSVVSQIPDALQIYCENIAVNAVVAYYIERAKEMGVTVSVQLVVPESLERISDNSLCVIFGNLLENAVEACGRMHDSGRFITLTSHIRNEMLVISQKNSFEGHIHQVDGTFYSSKRDEFGIGLSSIHSVARKHSGNATFTPEGRVFQSSIYVRI